MSSTNLAAVAPSPIISCVNCHGAMRIDDHVSRNPDSPPKSDSSNTLHVEEEDNQPKNLMTLISDSRVPTDCPICKDCADKLMSDIDRQLDALEGDCIKYKNLIDDIRAKHSDTDLLEYKSTMEKLKRDEEALSAEYRALIAEEKRLDDELLVEKEKLEKSQAEEDKKWRELRDLHAKLMEMDEQKRLYNLEKRYAERQLQVLGRTNVLSLCFQIDMESSPSRSPIGRINGHRLGRLPDVPVDWPEINAAWGQALLLLDILVERMKVPLPDVTLVPLGSYSSIKVTRGSQTKEYPLYCSGSWKPFGNKNTDLGAREFLEILAKLLDAIVAWHRQNDGEPSRQHPGLIWPHQIREDRVRVSDMEYTVKMMFNAEERWTMAMRGMLANLKWAIAMVQPAVP